MKKTKSGVEEGTGGDSPSQMIDARIKDLSDWRGETLARIRMLIKQAALGAGLLTPPLHRPQVSSASRGPHWMPTTWLASAS